jgi:Leucine-rich repeat (LRR) protein
LSNLSHVQRLYLNYNYISNISSLALIWIPKMRNLVWLELQGNYLDTAAYDVYLPMIKEINPEIVINHDPI